MPEILPLSADNRSGMRDRLVRSTGLATTVLYAAAIGWLYARQPQTVAEMTGALTASVGAYRVDADAFQRGLDLFRSGQYEAARLAFERADPARQDARTQFYIAYSYYRQGWGRVYNDDALFAPGLEAIDRAIAVAPGGRVVVDDPDLQMKSGEQLKAELQAGLRHDASDFNPMRLFRQRK
jgi:tetratricopeptide (TPR) repeat protein